VPELERDPHFGCELWPANKLNNSGYGTAWIDGKPRMAHYVAFERARGPVPGNLVLDHLCRRRRCTAVAHLEPVTQAENTRRRSFAYRLRITKCPKGHDLYQHGRRTPEAGVVCRICSGVWTPPPSNPSEK
jgi:hypothetical protein